MPRLIDYEKKLCDLEPGSSTKISNPKSWIPLPEVLLKKAWGKVLDVGCGAGFFLNRFQEKRPDLYFYAIDISKNAIKLAKKNYPKIKFKQANAEKLPFPNNFFNVIISKQVLEHLQKPEQALEEVYRALKPGGLFYLETPVEADQIIKPPRRLTDKYQGHVQHFSKMYLIRTMKKMGFAIDSYYYSGFIYDQILNFTCLHLYEYLGLSREFSVEKYLYQEDSHRDKKIWRVGLHKLKNLIFALRNLEMIIVPKYIPGSNIHILARK